ncbi:MAG: BREX protein BrxB domain-containing protein [Rhodospirillaceae bacterium]
MWLDADRKAPLEWARTNASLANALTRQNQLQSRLEELLSRLEGKPNNILLVTDLESLHPYLRIGAIEAQLQGKFHAPTIFFYPGIRAGKTGLRFLGFYPEDGNYRSVHVGG